MQVDSKTPLRAVEDVDQDLARLLPERDSLPRAIEHLEKVSTPQSYIEEAFERQRLWQDSGLYYASTGRFHEATELFRRLHERICEVQSSQEEWLPRGMPLVWIYDFLRTPLLQRPNIAFRYLLLSGVSDAVRHQGELKPGLGFYWRARWNEGLSDADINAFYADCYTEFQRGSKYRFFPEYLLSRVGHRFTFPYPNHTELDTYFVNRVYTQTILKSIRAAHSASRRIDGKDLEALAEYVLSCIPGFEVELDLRTGDAQFDAIIRNRGPRYDFRADLGTYMLVECKDWSKRVGAEEMGWFVNKLMMQDCRAGVLFSSGGITGEETAKEGDPRFAALTLLKAYYRGGRIVIVLNETDFEAASRGDNLIRILQGKYERVRFDIRTQ